MLLLLLLFSRSVVSDSATPWTIGYQAPLPSTIFCSLLKFMCIELAILSNHLILCCPFLLSPSVFPIIRSFPVSWLFVSGSQSTGGSASAVVLPKNILGWFPLGLTGLISLQSKGLSRVFSKGISSLLLSLLYGPTLKSINDYWKNHSFDYTELCE